jgi:hypothetical protein
MCRKKTNVKIFNPQKFRILQLCQKFLMEQKFLPATQLWKKKSHTALGVCSVSWFSRLGEKNQESRCPLERDICEEAARTISGGAARGFILGRVWGVCARAHARLQPLAWRYHVGSLLALAQSFASVRVSLVDTTLALTAFRSSERVRESRSQRALCVAGAASTHPPMLVPSSLQAR